ncbi:MAG: hypothetical protein D8M59_10280 [Planctomycetes bacterium]|nr:hypothetical protein [Planctomycetota bacterium]NOG55230.1 hypothetical protein [Planctomycetota bacterium]
MRWKRVRIGSAVSAIGLVCMATATAPAQECEPSGVALLQPDYEVKYSEFGCSVALWGDMCLVGDPGYPNRHDEKTGAVFLFRRSGTRWVLEDKLRASDGEAGDGFGRSIAVSNDLLIVGASKSDGRWADAGAVYVFRWNGTTWDEEAKLYAFDGHEGQYFSSSLAVDDDVIVVGAPYDDQNGQWSGSAYVFRWDGAQWITDAKLLFPDVLEKDFFGRSVAVADNMIMVGASGNSGAVYVFRYDGHYWYLDQRVPAPDGSWGDEFGHAVAMHGNRAVVGMPEGDGHNRYSGVAYTYEWTGSAWVEDTQLEASDGEEGGLFGHAVAISGDTIIVGAPAIYSSEYAAGAVYIYQNTGSQWSEAYRIEAWERYDEDQFGLAVALSGHTILIGANTEYIRPFGPSAWVFRVADSPILVAQHECPGGGPMTIKWSCTTPGGRVALIYGSNHGELTIPDGNACAGTQLQLGGPRVVVISALLWSDSHGNGSMVGTLPEGACGGYLQLIDVTTCEVSNLTPLK